VLPKNTKVVMTSNHCTNPMQLGPHGLVKKAIGFGGHWPVLTNRAERCLSLHQQNVNFLLRLLGGSICCVRFSWNYLCGNVDIANIV
jgi:hypothetical protein